MRGVVGREDKKRKGNTGKKQQKGRKKGENRKVDGQS